MVGRSLARSPTTAGKTRSVAETEATAFSANNRPGPDVHERAGILRNIRP